MFLHARELRFTHPATGAMIELTAPLPAECVTLVRAPRARVPVTMTSPSTRPRQFDLIAFDWDGTLFDSTALISALDQAACGDLGHRGAERPRRQLRDRPGPGRGLAACRAGACRASATTNSARAIAITIRRVPHEIMFFDGTLAMLQALKRRHHLIAVATGKSRSGLDAALDASVDGAALRSLFDASRTADETASQPHPRMLLELMANSASRPSEVS